MALSDEEVLQLYNWYCEGMSPRDLARHFDITEPYVYSLIHGRTRKRIHEIYFGKKEGGE